MTGFQLVQTFYWLALSTWFGSVFFVLLIASAVFRTLRDAKPILPDVLAVNLEDQHASLLAGQVLASILKLIGVAQLACAGILLLSLIAQLFVVDVGGPARINFIIRATIFFAAVGIALYDRQVVGARALQYRQEFIDHADEPEVANPAKDQFDRYQRESSLMLMIETVLLSLLIVFSSAVMAPRMILTF